MYVWMKTHSKYSKILSFQKKGNICLLLNFAKYTGKINRIISRDIIVKLPQNESSMLERKWKCAQCEIRREEWSTEQQSDKAGKATVSVRVENTFSSIYIWKIESSTRIFVFHTSENQRKKRTLYKMNCKERYIQNDTII